MSAGERKDNWESEETSWRVKRHLEIKRNLGDACGGEVI